jgi:hypothetical protein
MASLAAGARGLCRTAASRPVLHARPVPRSLAWAVPSRAMGAVPRMDFMDPLELEGLLTDEEKMIMVSLLGWVGREGHTHDVDLVLG